jgi:hypothetical protein
MMATRLMRAMEHLVFRGANYTRPCPLGRMPEINRRRRATQALNRKFKRKHKARKQA